MNNSRVIALAISFAVVTTQAFPGEWTDWEWVEPKPQGRQLYAVASSHDTVVAVGGAGAIVFSNDGLQWDVIEPKRSEALYDVVWTGDQFIAVGSGTILTSPDGCEWTDPLRFFVVDLRTVIWTGNEAIAFGRYGISYRSADGVTWIEYRPDNSEELFLDDVAWNGEVFVGVGSISFQEETVGIFISDDGREWRSLDGDDVPHFYYKSITWGNGIFVVVGNRIHPKPTKIMVSENGLEWEPVSIDHSSGGFLDVAFFDGGFAAIGGSGLFALSRNGADWTIYNSGDRSHGFGVGSFSQTMVVVGQNGLITTSRNAITWNQVNQRVFDLGNVRINDIARGSGLYIAVTPGYLGWSYDGNEWAAKETLEYWGAVRWAEGAFWATRYKDGPPAGAEIAMSTNGETWEVVLAGWDVGILEFMDVAVTQDVIVAVGWTDQAAAIATKRDGEDWAYQEFPERSRNFSSVIWTGERFLVAGYLYDGVLLASFDGLTWFTQEVGVPMSIRWFESNGESTVGIGRTRYANSIVSSKDGVTWEVSDLGEEPPALGDITWTGDRFVAVGSHILTSRDGRSWAVDTNPFPFYAKCVAGDESTLITAGSEGAIFRASRVERPPRLGDERAAPDGPG